MDPSSSIVLIRHGETVYNREGRAQGLLNNPLNSTGRAQAEQLGNLVRNKFKIEKVWSSDLVRSADTAKAISNNAEHSLLLREMDLGEWDGKLWSEIYSKYPADVSKFTQSFPSFRPPGGESFEELVARASLFISKSGILNTPIGKTTVVVSHGWLCAALIVSMLGMRVKDSCRFPLNNAGIATLDIVLGFTRLTSLNAYQQSGTGYFIPDEYNCSRVVLIRHGESHGNIKNIAQGVKDYSLTDNGVAQAYSTAKAFNKEFKPVKVWSSNLSRAQVTAEIVAKNVSISSLLREVDIGWWGGILWKDLEKHYLEDVLSFRRGELDFRKHGGESFREVLSRAKEFINHANVIETKGEIAIVAHTWMLKALVTSLLELNTNSNGYIARFAFSNAGISVLEVVNGFYRLVKMNKNGGQLL